jgi:hypothetical protein
MANIAILATPCTTFQVYVQKMAKVFADTLALEDTVRHTSPISHHEILEEIHVVEQPHWLSDHTACTMCFEIVRTHTVARWRGIRDQQAHRTLPYEGDDERFGEIPFSMDIPIGISIDILISISMDISMDFPIEIPIEISMDRSMDISMGISMGMPVIIYPCIYP